MKNPWLDQPNAKENGDSRKSRTKYMFDGALFFDEALSRQSEGRAEMSREIALQFEEKPVGSRPFYGLGAQADGHIYDSRNARYGVEKEDIELIERRLGRLKLANARMFIDLRWFNPSLDGKSFGLDSEDARCCLDQMRRHGANGTLCNLVLFQPIPQTSAEALALTEIFLSLLEYFVVRQGISAIRWVTLWNEPDSFFLHDSPLMRRVFGDNAFAKRLRWDDYVTINRKAYEGLYARGLRPSIQLMFADCVWGARVREERMRLAVNAFREMDVAYSYHNYNPEDLSFYKGNPDFAYHGMERESALFRELVGPASPLLLTEFNAVGAGFSSSFMGCGPAGSEIHGSVAGAVTVADKVLKAASAGVDGFTIWLLHDLVIPCAGRVGPFRHGLWRYKSEGWHPRPTYHYYGALTDCFRPNSKIHRVNGAGSSLTALACEENGVRRLAALNTGKRTLRVRADLDPCALRVRLRRVNPEQLPPVSDLPAFEESVCETREGGLVFELAPSELAIVCTTE